MPRSQGSTPAPANDEDAGDGARRALWKGVIGFGLVSIPVSLYPASRGQAIDLDYLDSRDYAPVGYQRVNKVTGAVVEWKDIVKGYKLDDGEYVVLGEEDFRLANPQMTQTVSIEQFIAADAIPPIYFDTPYWLEPGRRGEKAYALLRETLARKKRIGLARVVIRTRSALAAVIPLGDALVLNTLRFDAEIRPAEGLHLPPGGRASVAQRELAMAERFVDELSADWDPASFRDDYRDDLMKRIQAKVKAGKTHAVPTADELPAPPRTSGKVVDLVALLERSLGARGGRKGASTAAPAKAASRARKSAPPARKVAAAARRKRAA